jgi:uncharacterized protein YoxC
MEAFLRSIPAAASSPYAFAAYAIAALVFLFAGARLQMAKLLLAKITSIPEAERRRALEIATGTVLPTKISPEQWIRHSRQRWTFLLLGSLLIVVLAVATIAILNPTKTVIEEVKKTTKETAKETQAVVQEGTKSTSAKIDKTTDQIVTTVQDAALATLETMFPLAVRIDRDVDGTIMHLNGSPRQRLVSYDNDLAPMKLHWGDRFHYFAYRERGGTFEPSTRLFLEIQSRASSQRLPLRLDPYSERELRIPGSSPEPMEAYFVNEAGISGIALKITIYSADRERGREEFREALMNTALNSAARRIYLVVTADGIRLRSEPSANGLVLRTIRQGTYVRVKDRSNDVEWSKIRLPEGREGWIKSEFLRPIVP